MTPSPNSLGAIPRLLNRVYKDDYSSPAVGACNYACFAQLFLASNLFFIRKLFNHPPTTVLFINRSYRRATLLNSSTSSGR